MRIWPLFIFTLLLSCTTFNKLGRSPASQEDNCFDLINDFDEIDSIYRVTDDDYEFLDIGNIDDIEVHGNHLSMELHGIFPDEDRLEYLGKFSTQPTIKNDGSIDDTEIHISYIKIEEDARGYGLQNIFYQRLVNLMPNLKKITTGLSETNALAFEDELEAILKERGKFNSRLGLDTILKSIPGSEQREILEEAVKNTPAYRSRKRVGFGLCKDEASVKIYDFNPLDVEFISCKQ